MSDNSRLTRILSIDGGGIRGILPGQILVALEKKLQKYSKNPEARIADYFDLIAGTSTGGILTCIYLTPHPDDPKKARFSAEEAVDLYLKNGSDIFSIPTFHKLRTAGGILDEKYPADNIERVLKEYLADLQLKDLIRPCLISAYDVFDSKAHFFTSQDAKKSEGRNFYVRDVARATSAAPTYFEPIEITSLSGVSYPLIDGGVFANNPTLCAYAEARQIDFDEHRKHPAARNMLILSLGTGETKRKYTHKDVKNWGAVQWIKPIIEIMMSGVGQTIHYQLRQIFRAGGIPDNYIRIEPNINTANPDMDDASPKNLALLKAAGTKAAEDYDTDELLEKLAERLVKEA